MKPKTKAIVKYSIDVIALLFCVVALYCVFKFVSSYESELFKLGVATGATIVLGYLVLLDILNPVFIFLLSKINKSKIHLSK